MIYLDNAATTRIAPEVLAAMLPFLTDDYGNAGTPYSLGRSAASAMQAAREKTAELFGCQPENIIFTSCGSEGNSLVFQGLQRSLIECGKTHLVVSAIEHDSVLRAAEALERRGFRVTYLNPASDGVINPKDVDAAITPNTGLVSVMYVNNETGATNDIREIGDICSAHGVLFHTDCVQAAGQYPIDVERCRVDFATISAHKFHGPKGVGAIYVRDLPLLEPLIFGGADQEFGIRGGTENIPGIVGMGEAARLAASNMRDGLTGVSILKQRFYTALLDTLRESGCSDEILHVNGRSVTEPGKVLSLRVDGVDAGTLVLALDAKGICISAGSACNTHETVPSHVLTAMGLSDDEARSSIRVSFSGYNSEEDATLAGETTARCIMDLRSL